MSDEDLADLIVAALAVPDPLLGLHRPVVAPHGPHYGQADLGTQEPIPSPAGDLHCVTKSYSQ